jgi:hypothetical protein
MVKQETEIHGTLVIDKNAKPFTPDLAARIFFGMSLDKLIEDIKKNPGGKYDDLYINDGTH